MEPDSESSSNRERRIATLRRSEAERRAAGVPLGRPRGAVNKLTAMLRRGIEHAYAELGGDEGFARWAKKNPASFYHLALKAVPREREANAIGTGVTIVLGDGRPVIDVTPSDDGAAS